MKNQQSIRNQAWCGITHITRGEGRTLKARSKILHHGRLTSVVRTQITGKHNRRVLEVVTTHAYRAA